MSRNERHIQTDGLDHKVRWAKDSVLPRLFQTGRATADENAFLRSFVSGISRELRKNNGTSVLGRCQFIFPKDVDRSQTGEEWEDKRDFDRLPSTFSQLSGQSTVCELETDESSIAIRFKVEEREIFSYAQEGNESQPNITWNVPSSQLEEKLAMVKELTRQSASSQLSTILMLLLLVYKRGQRISLPDQDSQ